MRTKLPTYDALMNPVLHALRSLGGSGTNEEILNRVISDLAISPEDASVLHDEKTKKTELAYRLVWTKTYLKSYGAISNDEKRGVWSIRPEFIEHEDVDKDEVARHFRQKSLDPKISRDKDIPSSESLDEMQPWRRKILDILRNMDPFAFERLIQLLLQKCGFINVKVTKKSGDGGIDGKGKFLLQDVVSIDVAFQCKRYKGIVASSVVRDFRGSLPSGVNQGILITTGTFSESAYEEAANVGKNHKIDLIDCEKLIDMIIKNKIGVHEVMAYEVDENFFKNI